jgi:uncharacterized protein (TIGR02302 family)
MSFHADGAPEGPPLKGRLLRLARLALFWEGVWPAAWPAVGVVGLFLAVAFAGVLALLPSWLHFVVLLGFGAALGWALYRFTRTFHAPSKAQAERRIERDSALVHRPLAALEDRLAVGDGDPFSEALWRAHLARVRRTLGNIRIGLPRPGLPRRDPIALRLLLILLLAIGLLDAGSEAPARLAAALLPQLGAITPRTPARVELWVTPPAYTGLAPVFLRAGETEPQKPESVAAPSAPGTVNVPVDSKVLARVSGGTGVPRLVVGDRAVPFKQVDESTYQLEDKITGGDHLAVQQGTRTIGQWTIAVVPDLPPKIAFATPPGKTLRAALRLEYAASHAYGIASVKAEIHRVGAPKDEAAIVLELPLASGHPKSAHETSFHDLTPHPWAGLPVEIQLMASDEPGQVGKSEPVQMVLPERTFNHPVARAIIEQRKILTQTPEKHLDVAMTLSAIAVHPDAFDSDIGVFLALIAARGELRLSGRPDTIARIQQVLWDTALAIEDGHLSLAERELRDIQRKLMDALEHNAPDKEIEKLIAQLQEAIDRYLQALAEQQMRNPDPNQQALDKNAQMLQRQDLQKMLERMREMARSGARDAARQLLAQLQDMLENMRAALANRNGQNGQNSASGLMRGLDDLIGKQDRLLQRTFRDAQQGGTGMPLQQPGSGNSSAEQEALRRSLGEIMRRMGEMAGNIPGQLGRAERAMRDAVEALNRGQPGDAVQAQSQALDALRQGRQAMLEGLRNKFGQEGDPEDLDAFGPARDPLGRVMPGFGTFDANDVRIPEHGDVQRAREIQEELQRRAGERRRPEIEREYIDRLLRRF